MNTRLFRTSVPVPPSDERTIPETVERIDSGILWAAAMKKAERACCCPAKPAVVAVITAPDGLRADLLLCRHHFLASRASLEKAGASVYDGDGEPVTNDVQVG